MAPKSEAYGNKRKLVDRSKDQSSKKPKFDKRQVQREEPEDGNDGSEISDFSDLDDGGAPLNDKKPQNNEWRNGNDQAGKVFEKGQNSRESHIKQRQLAQERKSQKPLADDLQRTKKLWERLRLKSKVPKEERQKLVEELFSITTGRMKDFALKHDAVRVVQTAIKYATPERRKMIAKELKGAYPVLAESKYAKFLIGKLLVKGDKEVRDIIVPEFFGRVRKLINHPEASWILDDIYRGIATKEQKAILLREWYGPEFHIFRQTTEGETAPSGELSQILAEEPSKRGPIMKYLLDLTNQLVQKKMTGFTMLHDAMYQYYTNAKQGSEEAKEYVEMIKEDENGDLLKNMAFTKSGARLVCLLLAHGTAKDRKQILKTYKDTFQLMSSDPNGHLIILAAYDLIDDTVLTSKSIISELIGKTEQDEVTNIVISINDPNARLTIRYPLEGASKALFDAGRADDLKLLEELWEIRKTTSKKDPEIRRKELVAALSPYLLTAIATSPLDLISTSHGSQMVTEALLSCVGDKSEALQAIASTAKGNPHEVEESEGVLTPREHISKASHGGRMFKTLISGGRFDKATRRIIPIDPPLSFSDILYPTIKDHIIAWATGPSSFVVLNLLEADDFSFKDELKSILKKNKKTLQKAATEETPEQKAAKEAVQEAADADGEKKPSKKKSKKAGSKKEAPVGNMGSKLLLEQIKG
ncbi:ARM repeat-containing protein [Annulohypoxylon maeteangense]|uniref:ARM repeat-containing protein n=1 Tax=Annulohypoxylon maeteangense TaxID=1927788 RepID=UPI002008BD7B|nr:ARM repeat-containing protein [Annulohypoxylon maeteangense]KAI0882729.1 ARM repeat-containing protein [Annulohypoxylon maeteangense]